MGARGAGRAHVGPAGGLSGGAAAPEIVAVDGPRPGPEIVARAVRHLARGELLIYPTDTLYALGGRALEAAVAVRVRRAKGRDDGKPLPLIAGDADQARGLCGRWTADADRLARRFWPGPLTLVLASTGVPDEVTSGTGTVAVRVPDLALARALCAGAGPLVSTSANLSGRPAPRTCAEAVRDVGPSAALALDAGPGREAPSTIVSLVGAEPALVREGAVPWADVRRALSERR